MSENVYESVLRNQVASVLGCPRLRVNLGLEGLDFQQHVLHSSVVSFGCMRNILWKVCFFLSPRQGCYIVKRTNTCRQAAQQAASCCLQLQKGYWCSPSNKLGLATNAQVPNVPPLQRLGLHWVPVLRGHLRSLHGAPFRGACANVGGFARSRTHTHTPLSIKRFMNPQILVDSTSEGRGRGLSYSVHHVSSCGVEVCQVVC